MGVKPYEDKEYELTQTQDTAADKAHEVINNVV